MLDQRREPIVMDFGLAGGINQPGEEKLTHTGMLLGTPAYMSPEQAEADFSRVGPASDVYSLGVICYELLTGQLPFQGPIAAVIVGIVRDEPRRPLELRPALDKRLEAICLKMMAKSPDDRYPTAAEVAAALRQFLEETATGSKSLAKSASQADRELDNRKREIVGLLQGGQFGPAADALEKLAHATGTGSDSYAAWARRELARVRALPANLLEKGPAVVETAIDLIASQQYAEAVDLLQAVPADYCSTEAAKLLDKATKLRQEAQQLNARMQQAVRTQQYDGLQNNLSRLLELQPGNLIARELYDKLATYAPGRPYRFDKSGKLLSAHRTPLLVLLGSTMRQALRGYAQRQKYRRDPAGKRVSAAEPAPARPALPILPIAIAAVAFALIVLAIVVLLRDGDQTVRVEIDDALLADNSITLHIDGNRMEIAGLGETIKLAPGDHGYELRRGDELIRSAEFEVLKGDAAVLRISLGDPSVASVDAGRGPGASGSVTAGLQERTTPLAAAAPPGPGHERWLGYKVYESPENIREFSSHTNIVIDGGWPDYGDRLVKEAARSKTKTVLSCSVAKEGEDQVDDAIEMARRYPDAVSAIVWRAPVRQRIATENLSRTGQRIKAAVPGIEFWAYFGTKFKDPQPVPDEVDVLMVGIYDVTEPSQLQGKADDLLSGWIREAKGRPVVMQWVAWRQALPHGLVPECRPEVMSMCAQVCQQYGLRGLILNCYGPAVERVGIETSPQLVSEIEAIAQDWGIGEANSLLSPSPQKAAEGFVSLFDGKTLDGWEGATEHYVVEDGKLVSDFGDRPFQGPGGGHLFSTRRYDDFILRFEFKPARGGNSGVLIRAPREGAPAHDGMEIQILDDSFPMWAERLKSRPWQFTGAISGAAAPKLGHEKPPGEWNRMEILCQDRRARVTLNGEAVLDVDLDEVAKAPSNGKPHPGLRREQGYIGLLGTSSQGRVEYRNIRIKELDPAEAKRLEERGNELAQRAQWGPAAAEFGKAVNLDPSGHYNWLRLAALLLQTGDEAEYRRVCRDMLAEFGRTDNPWAAERTAKVCLLAPDAVEDLSLPVQLVDRALAVRNGQESLKQNEKMQLKWSHLAKGMADYRKGQWTSAVEHLEGCRELDVPGDGIWREFAFYQETMVTLFVAMAQHRQGDGAKAQRSLAEARRIMAEQFPTTDRGDLGKLWDSWVICQIARREAEDLLNGSQ